MLEKSIVSVGLDSLTLKENGSAFFNCVFLTGLIVQALLTCLANAICLMRLVMIHF